MRVLAIETSELVGSLAVLESSTTGITEVQALMLPENQRSAQSLVPTIKQLLGTCGWKPRQLDLICVTTGPGSFTGLRIGVTTAKCLAYATGAKLAEVNTLAAMAAGVTRHDQRLWTILNAQRQELFVAQFDADWQGHTPATRIVSIEQWLRQVQAGDAVSGPPLKKLADQLPAGVRIAEEAVWPPRAAYVGQLGITAHQLGRTVDTMQLVPHYYRKSAAEEKAEIKVPHM